MMERTLKDFWYVAAKHYSKCY